MSINKFILPFPPSVNARYNISRGKRVKSKSDKDWILQATNAINQQNVLPIVGRCFVFYELCHPDNRHRDAANYEKKVTDLLVSLNILAGDDRRYIKGTFPYWNDKQGDYITVSIVPVDMVDLSVIIASIPLHTDK
jgi:Holliday junction resolvase RusA-like endonuclease